MSILGELGGLVSPALTVGTQAAAAQEGAQARENETQKSDALQLLALLRQKQQMDSQLTYQGAETSEANARAKWYGETPLRPFVNADGSVGAAPTRTGPDGSVPAVAPLAGLTAPPPAPKVVASPTGYVSIPRTGNATQVLGPDGKPVMPMPRGTGAGSPNMTIVHTMSSVKTQIDETQRQLAAANAQAKALNDPAGAEFLSDAAKSQGQAAQARIPQLQQRLDSLTTVHDKLASQQQRAAGTPPPAYTAPAKAAPTAPPRNVTADSTKLAADLNTMLQSPRLSPTEKDRARQLFRQKLLDLRSPNAAPAGGGQEDDE